MQRFRMKLGACGAVVLILCSTAVVVICITSVSGIGFHRPPSVEPVDSDKPLLTDPNPLLIPSGNCNCTISYTANELQPLLPTPSLFCQCEDPTVCPVCPPRELQVVEKEVVKVEEGACASAIVPWHAEGKTWHYPARFPLCSMDACFDYAKCEVGEELLIYTYNLPSPPRRYFARINETKYFTDDPQRACVFLVFLDGDTPWPPHPETLPHWNGGRNHALVTFADKWSQRGPPQESIGLASVMASDAHETTYRLGFDISIPLPGIVHSREMQPVKALERKYLATFRGLRYLGASGEGVFRSYESFRGMHNGDDVIVATSCNHPVNNMNREKDSALGAHCEEDESIHRNHTFADLMNSTFALVPAGIQPASYRFIEALSAGAIPVLIADNYVKPFETLILWYKCLLQFPTSEMHRIVGTLRVMKAEEIVARQANCLAIYSEFLKDDDTLLRSAVGALKARFLGAIPSFTEVRRSRRRRL